MRKFAIFFVVIAFALGIGVFSSFVKSDDNNKLITSDPKASSIIAQPSVSQVLTPVKLSIPKIEVDVDVEHVGLDEENAMDIPKDEYNAAWYELGAKPGELGNAVIAAHFDDKQGEPSVFYRLNELEAGDEILVTDEKGKTLKYRVTDSTSYELADFPLEEVFGANTKSRLNLITCEGVFNKSSKLYSHRLVVFSELVE